MAKKRTMQACNGKDSTNNGKLPLTEENCGDKTTQMLKCDKCRTVTNHDEAKEVRGRQSSHSTKVWWFLFSCVCVVSIITRLYKIEEPAHVW